MQRTPKQRSKPQPGRNARGQFKRGFSGNHLGHPKALATDSSVAELVAGMASTKRIAKALLARATDGDPRALELVLQMLSRSQAANIRKAEPNYDLLTTPQLLVIRALSGKTHGEIVSDSELLELLQKAVAELEPAADENDVEEREETSDAEPQHDSVSDAEVAEFLREGGPQAIDGVPAAGGYDPDDPDLLINQQRIEKEKQQQAWDRLYNAGDSLPIPRKPSGYLT